MEMCVHWAGRGMLLVGKKKGVWGTVHSHILVVVGGMSSGTLPGTLGQACPQAWQHLLPCLLPGTLPGMVPNLLSNVLAACPGVPGSIPKTGAQDVPRRAVSNAWKPPFASPLRPEGGGYWLIVTQRLYTPKHTTATTTTLPERRTPAQAIGIGWGRGGSGGPGGGIGFK